MLVARIETIGEEWDPRYWDTLPGKIDRDLMAVLNKWKRIMVAEVRANAPHLSGKLARSVEGYVDTLAREIVLSVQAPYSEAVEMGSGIFAEAEGALRRPITAKFARALRIPIGNFRSPRSAPAEAQSYEVRPGAVRAGTAFIFRRSIKGQRAQHFFYKTIERRQQEIEDDVLAVFERHGFTR